jgi:hypothetical protein
MIEWYLKSRRLLRDLQKKAIDALRLSEDDEAKAAKAIAEYMKSDFQQLRDH